MNAIHQISLKLQLGLDPSCNINSEQLLEQWQDFNARRCRARALQRAANSSSTPSAEQSQRRSRVN